MADLKQLLAQKAALDKQIEDTKREQRTQAIAKIRELMTEYGLTPSDLQDRRAASPAGKRAKPTRKVAAKYRNAATGETWSGRGLQPRWLKALIDAGRRLEDFRV